VCVCVVLHRADRQRQMVTLSEKEFDDILQRNKSVSSGAIMRAVQDASEGFLISDTHTHTRYYESCTGCQRRFFNLRYTHTLSLLYMFRYY